MFSPLSLAKLLRRAITRVPPVADDGLRVGGRFSITVNGVEVELADNLVTDQGINAILNGYFRNAGVPAAFYLAPFAGNVTPQPSWTGANFTAQSTEFINYTENTRQQWTPADATAKSLSNLASRAVITIGQGGGTIYGVGVLTASAKSSTSGICNSAALFAAPRVLQEGDQLGIGYVFNGASATS